MILEEQELDTLLEEIAATRDEFMQRRLNHLNFKRMIIWMSIKSRNSQFIYSCDLADWLKLSMARTNQILNDLARIKVMDKRTPVCNLAEWWFMYEDGVPIIAKYFEQAKKNLGMKINLKFTKEQNHENQK